MKTYEELKQHIQQVIEQEKQDLICLNNDLADHPEISGEEYESSRKIVSLLQAKGYQEIGRAHV